ncbi:MAG TPA: amidohydrolase, partial [Gemmata sp.]
MHGRAAFVPIVIALSLPFVPAGRAGAPKAPEGGAADTVTVFKNATLHTAATDKPIENGTLVVRGGKIADVGPAANVKIPAGAEVFDLKGAVIIPGLVDTH